MRSERREAVTVVVEVMCKHMDLATMQVGVPTPNGFYNYSFEKIRAETDLGISRFQRAIKDIKKCTGFDVNQLYKQDADGSYKGMAAVKKMSMHLFKVIGLGISDAARTAESESAHAKERKGEVCVAKQRREIATRRRGIRAR